MKNITVLPTSIQTSAFFFLFAAYFLIFFNDFLGFEGALGLVLLFTIFLKLKYFKGKKVELFIEEKYLVGVISFYIFVMFLSTYINYQEYRDVEGFFAKYNKVLYFIAFVFILKFLDFSFVKFQLFIKIMAIAIIFMVLLELLIYGYETHLGIEFSNKGTGAWFFSSVLIGSFLIFLYKLKLSEKKEAIIYFLLSVVLAIVLIFSSVRSIWLSLFLTFILLAPLVVIRLDLKRFLTKKMVVISLSFMIVILGISFDKLSSRFDEAKNDIVQMQNGHFYTSLGQRVIMYGIAIDGIHNQPFTGLGEVNYKEYMNNIYKQHSGSEDHAMYKQISKYKQIHNQFLMDTWMKGVLGFVSITFLFLVPWIIFYKAVESLELKILGLMGLGYLINSFIFFQFGAVLTYSHGIVFFFLWLVLLVAVVSNLRSKLKVER